MSITSKSISIAVVAGAVIVAAALVYAGRQYASRLDEQRVAALVDERLAQAPAGKTLSEPEIAALIDKRLSERKASGGMSDDAFNARVEKGITAYIEKQRRAEQERPNQLARNVPKPGKTDHVYGNADAAVTLIEYSDFECPYCKQFHLSAKRLVDASGGKVNWVYRHFPLEFHNPGAQKQAEASECAAALGGNDAFWKFTDAVYERTTAGGKGFALDALAPLAAEIGLNQNEFKKCLDGGGMAARVKRDLESGANSGINGTPGNILLHVKSGRVVAIHGAQPFERLDEAAKSLLKTN